MISEFLRRFPSRVFVLANVLFWLLMTVVATENSYRRQMLRSANVDWFEYWCYYLPWWGNWAIVTPILIAFARTVRLDDQHRVGFVAKNLLMIVIVMPIYWLVCSVESHLLNNDWGINLDVLLESLSSLVYTPIHLDIMLYVAVIGVGYTISHYERSKEQALHNQNLVNQLLETELQALKSQLSPHFLFNTLNTISGLVRLDQKNDAVSALSELSHMFRKVLENQRRQLTTLNTEMEFIQSYLSIQKMRFEDKLDIELEVDPQCLHAELPFMLLHTLVENAVQHGSQLESDHNLLKLEIKQQDDKLAIRLTNKVCHSSDHKGFGIGLDNCKKRLQHIYGDDHHFEHKEIENGQYLSCLTLPFGGPDV